MSQTKIYLDYASATPIDNRVLAKMLTAYNNNYFNASAIYDGGLKAKHQLNQARQKIASIIGTRPAEIIFTSGGSESNNLAIQGVMNNFPGTNLAVSAVEHDSVLMPAKNYKHKLISVNASGQINITDLLKKINDNTVLVSVQLASNEIGTIQPIKLVAQELIKIRAQRLKTGNDLPIYLHCDACQAVNYLDINTARLGVDLMSVNGGKIYGPKSAGFLFVKAGTKLKPLIYGGGQEFGYRSGTEDLAGATGLAWALEITQKMRAKEAKRLSELSQYFYQALLKNSLTIILNGPKKNRLPNNLNLTFNGVDNERLIMRLDIMGLACSAGSACNASSDVPSHVLRAIGLSDKIAHSTIRFSLGRQTTKKDIDMAVKIITQSIELEQ